MKMTAEIANKVFDILVNEGNHDSNILDYKREEFVHMMTTGNGAGEHWYPTNCGSSIKVYFHGFFRPEITLYAQTINPIHEKDLVENANRALNELVASVLQ